MSLSKPTSTQQQSYASIMKGLKELYFGGEPVPCQLLLTGDHAFPLAINTDGHVLLAASTYGSGRIVVFSHEAYLTDFPDLVENALLWLRGEGSGNISVGIHKNVSAIANNLSNCSFRTKIMGDFSRDQGVGVYVTDAYSVRADEEKIVGFMRAGGGVLIGGQAWWWSSQHPKDNVLLKFEGNRVSAVSGIHFTNHYGEKGRVCIRPQVPYSWKTIRISFQEDLEFLLKGVSEFDVQGESLFSEVLAHSPLSFNIGTTADDRAFLSGAFYGKGRVVVISHEGFLDHEGLTGFWDNVLHWLDQGRMGVVGVIPDIDLRTLRRSGLKCKKTGFRKDLSVFVNTVYNGEHIQEIQEFVAEGGGLLIGGHAWWWAQSHPHQNYMTECEGNKILNPMGLSLLSSIIEGGIYKAPTNMSYPFLHLLNRFTCHVIENKAMTSDEEQCLAKLGQHCACFLQMENDNCSTYMNVVCSLTEILQKTGLPQVSESCPVKSPKDHLLLNIAAEVYKVCPNPEELVQYLIRENPQRPTIQNQRIKISVKTADEEEWVSTGLYLTPGMKTVVTMPTETINKRWKVQIGCQTDHLSHQELKRAPCVCEWFPVSADRIQVHSLWGGLIYLIAPPHTQLTGEEAVVHRAVPAPYYKSGVTSLSDWAVLRSAPSPWAELEFENIILTVPSEVVRSLERPDELAAHWDRIMRAIADLAAIPHKFKRKERFVTDVQISAGWLHSGYPVMAHMPLAADVVSIKNAKDMWGPIHEYGHNQQRACWEFPDHTTEATCNLWSVYVHETVLGIPREKAHEELTLANRRRRTEKFVQKGRSLSEWSVWTALETYLQLQEKFGWDAFKKVFGAYHTMQNVPDDNKEKMNLYAVTFSQTVLMDLTGFLKAWGWPIDTGTEKKLSNLPAWTNHPMVKYN